MDSKLPLRLTVQQKADYVALQSILLKLSSIKDSDIDSVLTILEISDPEVRVQAATSIVNYIELLTTLYSPPMGSISFFKNKLDI